MHVIQGAVLHVYIEAYRQRMTHLGKSLNMEGALEVIIARSLKSMRLLLQFCKMHHCIQSQTV